MIDDSFAKTNLQLPEMSDMTLCVTRLLWSLLAIIVTACGSPPDRISLYPGFTYDQLSQLVPGTGEYLNEHRWINLDPAAVDIVDPTTNHAFVSLESTFAALDSDGRILSRATIHAPDDRGRIATYDSLVSTVRAFIELGWRCHARDNPEGPAVEASKVALPEGFCIANREFGRGWTCASPPNWPEAAAVFTWGCGALTNDFAFTWGLELVAASD